MLELRNIPLSVYNRALDLYSQPREMTINAARMALESAEQRIALRTIPTVVIEGEASHGIQPFCIALAEYMSLSGPWSEDDGERAGESGYRIIE